MDQKTRAQFARTCKRIAFLSRHAPWAMDTSLFSIGSRPLPPWVRFLPTVKVVESVDVDPAYLDQCLLAPEVITTLTLAYTVWHQPSTPLRLPPLPNLTELIVKRLSFLPDLSDVAWILRLPWPPTLRRLQLHMVSMSRDDAATIRWDRGMLPAPIQTLILMGPFGESQLETLPPHITTLHLADPRARKAATRARLPATVTTLDLKVRF